MKLSVKRTTIVELISALFILLFVYTAINKLLQIDLLKAVLKEYPLIGGMATVVAWSLPAIEIIVATSLFIPRLRLLGL